MTRHHSIGPNGPLPIRRLIEWLALALSYAMLGAIGLSLAIPPGYASPVFPAAGLALAAVLSFGPAILPGVWLGSFALNIGVAAQHEMLDAVSLEVSLGIATGAALQAALGYLLLHPQWASGDRQLIKERDILRFLALGGPAACLVSATIGVASLRQAAIIEPAKFAYSWFNWYVGDTLGVLLFTPLSLAALQRHLPLWQERLRLIGAVMFVALLGAGAIFVFISDWEHQSQKADLTERANAISHRLEEAFSIQREILAGVADVFESSPDLDEATFNQVAHRVLAAHPDIFALSFNPIISETRRAQFEAAMSSTVPGGEFRILERGEQGQLVPAQRREQHVVVKFIAPLSRNEQAIGFDIASDSVRREALTHARASGSPAVTAPLRLVQTDSQQIAVLLIQPVRDGRQALVVPTEQRLMGFVVAVVRVDHAASLALKDLLSPGLIVQINDGDASDPMSRLFRSEADAKPPQGEFLWQGDIRIADRSWQIKVFPSEAYLQENRPWLAWMVGVGSLLVATLLQILLLSMTGRTSLVREQVEAQTLALRQSANELAESDERYRRLFDDSRVPIMIIDPESGQILAANQAAEHYYGYPPSQLMRMKITDINQLTPDEVKQAMEVARAERRNHFQFLHRLANGQTRHVEVHSGPMVIQGRKVLYSIVHDISDRVNAEAAHRAAEARHRSVVNSVKEVIFHIDRDGRWTFLNPAWTEITALRLESCIGRAMTDFVHPDDRRRIVDAHARLMGGIATDQRYQFRVITRDGEIRWLEAFARATQFNDEVVDGISGTLDDVTDRRTAEAELETYRHHLERLVEARTNELLKTEARAMHILQSSADGLFGVSIDGRITYINRAACEMLGYEEDAVLGKNAHDLFHHSRPNGEPFAGEDCPGLQALQNGRPHREDDDTFWHAAGHPIPVTYSIYPLNIAGEFIGSVVSFVNMSARRSAELSMKQALDAAENLAQARAQFIANVSHELRTPLHAVLSFAALGMRHVNNPERASTNFEKIMKSGRLLLSVVNDILDFAATEAGKLRVECSPVRVSSVINEAVELVSERVQAKGLLLDVEMEDPTLDCLADRLRLSQILMNLLSNAIKFTDQGSIVVECKRHKGKVLVTVSDTGIGMTQDAIQRAFKPFEQVDGSATRRASGTGLGLAISRNLAELMGGALQATSQPGLGSHFTLALPASSL